MIVANVATQYGQSQSKGGGVAIDRSGEVNAINCTIANNVAYEGAGWFQHRNNDAGSIVRNCIIYGNVGTSHPQVSFTNVSADTLDIDRSDIEGGWADIGPNHPTSYNDNQDVDPLFVDATNGNYRLSCSSLCVDAGNPNAALIPPDTYNINAGINGALGISEPTPDRGLYKRIGHATVDQGAHERHNCPGDVDQNGLVDIDDTLAVVNQWGPCSGCPADVYPLPCGNGVVDIDDLLLGVNNNWGKDYRAGGCAEWVAFNAGDLNSILDCMEAATNKGMTPFSLEWVETVNDCTTALCLSGEIICD